MIKPLIYAFGIGLFIIIPASYVFPAVHLQTQSQAFTYGNYWYPKLAIEQGRAGVVTADYGTKMALGVTVDAIHAYMFAFWAILGRVYLQDHFRTSKWDFFKARDDAPTAFCKRLLDYTWGHPFQSGSSYPSVYADVRDVADFAEACKKEFPLLSVDERKLLSGWWESGSIPIHDILPQSHDTDQILGTLYTARAQGVAEYKSEKYTTAELVQLFTNSAPEEHKLLISDAIEHITLFDVRKPTQLPSDFKAIGSAILRGEIGVFDARPLFPSELFNITQEALAANEGPDASRISIWHAGHKPISLYGYAKLFENIRKGIMPSKGETINGHINTRRMPNLWSKFPNVAEEIGLADDILRTESFLWMGPTAPPFYKCCDSYGLHYDEEPNIYIQLRGETDVILIPQNFTDVSHGAARHPAFTKREAAIADPYSKNIVVEVFHMSPGNGLTFPGQTYHVFAASDWDRIALNFFFLPKWRKMEYHSADWYSKEANYSLPRLALRQLWARSFVRLYEETKKGPIFMGGKLEYI